MFASQTVLKNVGIPLALLSTPFAAAENGDNNLLFKHFNLSNVFIQIYEYSGEQPVAAVDYTIDTNPPRCTRCMGYINSSVTWGDNGNDWFVLLIQKYIHLLD